MNLRLTSATLTPASRARAGQRERHIGLGLRPEIDRPVIDLVRNRFEEHRIGREVGSAADHVHRRARHAQLLASRRVELGHFGDRRHLPQQAREHRSATRRACRRPRQLVVHPTGFRFRERTDRSWPPPAPPARAAGGPARPCIPASKKISRTPFEIRATQTTATKNNTYLRNSRPRNFAPAPSVWTATVSLCRSFMRSPHRSARRA